MEIEQAPIAKADRALLPKVSSEIVLVNATVARHLLESALFPRQRDPQEENIERLRREYERGWYVHGTPLFFALLPNRDAYLLNGQHSLHALIRADAVMQFTAIYHQVGSLEEAGHLYSRFDLHKRRTWGDAYKAAGMIEQGSLPKQWLEYCGYAVRAIMGRFKGHSSATPNFLNSVEMQLIVVKDYLGPTKAYHGSLAWKNGPRMSPWRRATVMGVALETFKYQPKKAMLFWLNASADDGLKRDDPRKLLHDYLFSTHCLSGQERQEAGCAAMSAWNAHMREESVKYLKTQLPAIEILGTPWKNGYDPLPEALKRVGVSLETGLSTARPIKADLGAKYDEITTGIRIEKSGREVPVTQYVGSGG